MIKELTAASLRVGLEINVEKTKLLANRRSNCYPIKIYGADVEEVTDLSISNSSLASRVITYARSGVGSRRAGTLFGNTDCSSLVERSM